MRYLLVIISIFVILACSKKAEVVDKKTTSAHIAITNLNSQINTSKKLMNSKKSNHYKKIFVSLTLMKMQFLNNFDDLTEVQKVVDLNSSDPMQMEINLKYLIFIHDYDRAERLLKKSNDKKLVSKFKNKLESGRGTNVKRLDTMPMNKITFNESISKANTLAIKGLFAKAETVLLREIENYKDVSPFPLAYIYFNLGLLWGEKGQNLNKAQSYYEKAISLLPEYSSAVVHLSEIYIEQENFEKALKLLVPLAENKDPEVFSSLAKIYNEQDKVKVRDFHINQADKRYKELLAKYPLAFYDHASEFYMGIGGNPKLATEYALKNLENRKGQRPYFIALEASDAAQDKKVKCSLLGQIEAESVTYKKFKEVYVETKNEC